MDAAVSDGMGAMTPAEHLDHAHRHTKAAGEHLDLAATHIKAARSDGDDGGDGEDSARGMPVIASPPSAGYAQNRTGFAAGTGAARAYRAATGRRK